MAKAPPYAQFLFNLSALKKEVGDAAFEGCDEVLAYLAVRESEGKLVKITELVQSLQFGTGPTVHRKILVLEGRKLIKLVTNKDDARAKDLLLTAAGLARMKDMSKLMKQWAEG